LVFVVETKEKKKETWGRDWCLGGGYKFGVGVLERRVLEPFSLSLFFM